MLLFLSAAMVSLSAILSLTMAGSCNVTAVSSQIAVDVVQLYVSEDADRLCLQNLASPIGALAVDSESREGLVVDSLNNSSVLLLVPLTAWEDLDTMSYSTDWSIEHEQCWLQLKPLLGWFSDIPHEMDINDELLLTADLCLNDTEQRIVRAATLLPDYFWYIHVHFDVLDNFECKVDMTRTQAGRRVSIHLWQRDSQPTVSDVKLAWMHAPSNGCALSQLKATVLSNCPSQKELQFIYPEEQSDHELVTLPVNYRPPSPLGSSLPTSPHVYNADPSQPLTNTHFRISQNAEFKQCQNKASRLECNCTHAFEHSLASDCIRKVYRHLYQKTFQLEFAISLGEGRREEVTEPITITEVNGRTSFEITGLENDYIIPETKDPVTIVFKGPELFHFQATVATNSSFCNLTTYFTVYVDKAPLMKAAEYSIIVSCTLVFGAVLAFMYLLHHFKLTGIDDHIHAQK